MKTFILTILGILITVNAYAVSITVNLTQDQYDAMSVLTSSPEQWLQDAANAKANKMIERLILKHSNKQAEKLTEQEKSAILKTIDLEKEKKERKGK